MRPAAYSFFCAWSHFPCIPQPSSFIDKLQVFCSIAKWHGKMAGGHEGKPPFVHIPFSLK
jgi:hypothetical protein